MDHTTALPAPLTWGAVIAGLGCSPDAANAAVELRDGLLHGVYEPAPPMWGCGDGMIPAVASIVQAWAEVDTPAATAWVAAHPESYAPGATGQREVLFSWIVGVYLAAMLAAAGPDAAGITAPDPGAGVDAFDAFSAVMHRRCTGTEPGYPAHHERGSTAAIAAAWAIAARLPAAAMEARGEKPHLGLPLLAPLRAPLTIHNLPIGEGRDIARGLLATQGPAILAAIIAAGPAE